MTDATLKTHHPANLRGYEPADPGHCPARRYLLALCPDHLERRADHARRSAHHQQREQHRGQYHSTVVWYIYRRRRADWPTNLAG